MASLTRDQLVQSLNELLEIERYDDYGPNGLQVEGVEQIKKIGYAVSATAESIERAIEAKVDALIVHHGLFWKFHGPRPLTGAFAKRTHPLIRHNINLLGYHLPLDGHQQLGNAACLADRLRLKTWLPFGATKSGAPTGCQAQFSEVRSPEQLAEEIKQVTGHSVLHARGPQTKIRSLGIITGGANSGWKEALDAGLDAYLTGEMSEHDWHEAAEAGVHMFAAGHHATEQFGVQALMDYVQQTWQIPGVFFQSQNPA